MSVKAPEVPLTHQLYELRLEFLEQSDIFVKPRSDIERQVALNHLNSILDSYLELIPTETDDGRGTE